MSAGTYGRRQGTAAERHGDDPWLRQGRLLDPRQADTLFRTVETEIIPRLMLLHRQGQQACDACADAANGRVLLGERDVERFTTLILQSQEAALAHLTELAASGATLDALCLNLLAPSARRLGDLWNADLCDFTAVTVALGRLQALLHSLSARMQLPRRANGAGRSVLFAPVPGEQHTFGLSMVCDFFRTSGWDVWGDAPAQSQAVIGLVRDHRFDLVGLAIGNDRSIPALAELIRCIRKSSKNRAVRVLAGGPLLVAQPQIAALVGADATAADASQAILAADRLMAMRDEGR